MRQSEMQLVGYIRQAHNGAFINGATITLCIDKKTFNKLTEKRTNDGREYVKLIVNSEKMKEILNGDREVTSIVHIEQEEEN